jgi:hypothetical protein
MSDFSNNSELDIVIKEVKQELKTMFLKRKDIIIKLGNEFEKVVANPESVCEEIKIALHEELANHIISSRDIERYCLDQWKKKTKPRKNVNLSFLTKIEEQENEESGTIAIDTQGGCIDELKSNNNTSQTCHKEKTCNLQPQEKSLKIENNAINIRTCPNCRQPLLENQTIQNEKDVKIKELKAEIQHYYNDLNIKRSEKCRVSNSSEFS